MSRTHRALAMLALSLALVTATAAVAAAAPPSPAGIEDQSDRLLRNLEAGQAERTEPRWSWPGRWSATSRRFPLPVSQPRSPRRGPTSWSPTGAWTCWSACWSA